MSKNLNKSLLFIKLAFEEAKINLGSTNTNPSVGCIIEKNGTVISSGRTSIYGRPHAEFNALKVKKNYKGANLYVSLEPCCHIGKTPPCTNKIIKSKIGKVFFSIYDQDNRTKKLAKRILKEKKIKVSTGLYNSYGKKFYKSKYAFVDDYPKQSSMTHSYGMGKGFGFSGPDALSFDGQTGTESEVQSVQQFFDDVP